MATARTTSPTGRRKRQQRIDDPVLAELARWGVPTAEDVVAEMGTYLPDADGDLVRRAYDFAANKHFGQKRKSGEPYFGHPVQVARLIMKLRLDEASVCAGLLHDVVEDCDVSLEEITEAFNEDIGHIVDGVTKLDKIPFTRREQKQAENFRKMLVAMSKDIRVLLIKLADRLHNMATLEHMRADKQKRIAVETIEIYAPLANRLGINWMKSLLEDYCFKYLYPADHAALKEKVGRKERERQAYIDNVVALLDAEMSGAGLPDAHIYGRSKHLFSIYRKMQRQGLPYDQIYDAQGFRVLIDSVEQCYQSLGVVHNRFTPIPGRFKDYIALTKANNYQSLHTSVMGPENRQIEIQIRTREMHQIAENGVAAHWRYKEQSAPLKAKDEQRFLWLRELIELNDTVTDNDEFLENMRIDLFNDEVYAFTPAGDVKVFPRDATPVDFAYSIHSKVGEHALGARINGVMVTLNTHIKNGDVVEILTRSDARPNQDWLEFVVTARAKTRIRAYIRAEQRARAMQVGEDLLEKAFRRQKYSMTRVKKHDGFAKTLSHFRCQTLPELNILVGYGKTNASDIVEHLLPEARGKEPEEEVEVKRPRRRRDGQAGIVVDGINDVVVRMAKCCSPVPGDDIVGFVTRGRGITVHVRNCPRAIDSDPMRQIDCDWDVSRGSAATVMVRVHTGNSPGMLAEMTEKFHIVGVNILQAHCRATHANRAVNEFELEVTDRAQLEQVLEALGRLDFVHRVERVRG